MSLLDFSEIPPAKAPSPDVDAFEKFAREFFEVLFGARVIKNVGRGPDGGADLILEVQGERWLVSCKHYKNTVPRHDEGAPLGDIQQWGCQQFIGFYSPGPSDGLESKLRQTRDNNPGFRFQIFDNKQIQNRLICTGSSEAWLLAFRWFPNSFAKIASSLVRPLTQHSLDEVLTDDGRSWIGGIPLHIRHARDNPQSRDEAAKELVAIANEMATEKTHAPIFVERAKDFCLALPGTFIRPAPIDDGAVEAHGLYPSWDLQLVHELCARRRLKGLRNLCRVWSFWSLERAEALYFYGRSLFDGNDPLFATPVVDIAQLMTLVAEHKDTWRFRAQARELSLSRTASDSTTSERGYLAALLCFQPGALSAEIPRQKAVRLMAATLDEQAALSKALQQVAATFSEDDQRYVEKWGASLGRMLDSVALIDPDYLQKVAQIDPALNCIGTPWTATWQPRAKSTANWPTP